METNMGLPNDQLMVLNALRSQADRLTWHKRQDGLAEVILDHALKELRLHDVNRRTFDSILQSLVRGELHKEIDNEHGLVDMGELPPTPDETRIDE